MNELAAELRSEVERAVERLQALSEADAARGRGEGKWVRKEILGHLIDSADNNHQRFVRARTADRLVLPGYDQRSWVAAHAYRDRPWLELVGLWSALNLHLAGVMATTPSEKLGTICVIGDHEPQPLDWWMRDYLRHLRHHLAQILSE